MSDQVNDNCQQHRRGRETLTNTHPSNIIKLNGDHKMERKQSLLYFIVRNDKRFLRKLEKWVTEHGFPRRFYYEFLISLRETPLNEGKDILSFLVEEGLFFSEDNRPEVSSGSDSKRQS